MRGAFVSFIAFLAWLLVPAPAFAQAADAQAAAPSQAAAPCGPENLLAGKAPLDRRDIRGEAALITDGAISSDGAEWNAPTAVTFHGGTGSVTYDLGRVTGVAAVYLQADANDVYRVFGSPDGAPQSYESLVDLANVVQRGHGLRSRSAEFDPKNVRFLRVEIGSGDGSASISELAAYCRAPAPFPPALKVVGPIAASEPAALPNERLSIVRATDSRANSGVPCLPCCIIRSVRARVSCA